VSSSATGGVSSRATSRPGTSVATRIAALATAAAALACVGASGGLHPALVPMAVIAMSLADLLTVTRSPRTDRLLRQWVMPVALVLCTGPALLGLVRAGGDPALIRAAGARLAAGALVVMPLAGCARRDLLARLALASATAGLATTGAGSRIAVPGLVFLVAALTMLALIERDRLGPRLASSRATVSPGPLARPLMPAVVAVVLAAAVAVPLGRALHLPDPPHAGSARTGSGSRTDASGRGPSSGDRLDPGAGAIDLRQRGSLPTGPVAHVSASEPTLWRTGYLTDYDGQTWRTGTADDRFGSESRIVGERRTDVVTPLDHSADLLLSPGEPVAADPAPDGSYGAGSYSMPDTPYTVTSVVPAVPAGDDTAVRASNGDGATGATGAADSTDSTDSTDSADSTAGTLTLPALPQRVVDLSRSLTAGAGSRAEAVDTVVRYLRQTYRYRLDSPVPPHGADAVDDFLFRSREGFCEQFASAAVVLLRAAGVPTRLAVGYADGVPDGTGRLLKGTDAHAWIEVRFPDAGWVAFDPTAGASRADAGAQTPGLWQRLENRLRAAGVDIAVLALAGVLVGGMAAFGAATVRRRRRERDLDSLERAMRQLDRRLGPGRRRPDETLREFAERLPYDDAARAAVLVAEQDHYAADLPDADRRRRAARDLRRRKKRRRTPVGSAGLR
jgi:transglutaminase-like putative cysteine protease